MWLLRAAFPDTSGLLTPGRREENRGPERRALREPAERAAGRDRGLGAHHGAAARPHAGGSAGVRAEAEQSRAAGCRCACGVGVSSGQLSRLEACRATLRPLEPVERRSDHTHVCPCDLTLTRAAHTALSPAAGAQKGGAGLEGR